MTRSQRKAEYKAQAARTARRRAELVLLLSPDLTCAFCGGVKSVAELVIDHADGKSWTANKLSSSQRVARYWREFKAGMPMRTLCNPCSDRDGAFRRHGKCWTPTANDAVPF